MQAQAVTLHQRAQTKSIFSQWAKRSRAYHSANNKASVRRQKLVAMAFKCLKLATQLRKARTYATMWHQQFTQKAVINSIRGLIARKHSHEESVRQMQTALGLKLVQKALLSFKYFVLT